MMRYFKRNIKFFIAALLPFINVISVTANAKQIEYAFVAYATQSYFPLLKVLLDSHAHFSKKPIIVYGVNAEVPFSSVEYPLLITRRIDINLDANRFYVWCYKSYIMRDANVTYGIYLDADAIIASPYIDLLFDLCKYADPFPLCPVHPDDVMDDKLTRLMEKLHVPAKSMHYVHDNIILFSDKSVNFLHEWYETGLRCVTTTPEDEKVLNVLLWKYNVRHYLSPIEFFWDKAATVMQINGKILKPNDFYANNAIYPLVLHGCKNIAIAPLLLDYIKKCTFTE